MAEYDDGERVTTGSEPRRWSYIESQIKGIVQDTVYRHGHSDHEAIACEATARIVDEVVERGHDERPATQEPDCETTCRGCGGDGCEVCDWTGHVSVWQPDERTVKAVVEALAKLGLLTMGAYDGSGSGVPVVAYAELERFNLKGTDDE